MSPLRPNIFFLSPLRLTSAIDLCIHEDSAEYHWTLIGTHRGPEGLGHRVQISGFERWHMAADGLIAASEGHFDAAEYERQLEQGCSQMSASSPPSLSAIGKLRSSLSVSGRRVLIALQLARGWLSRLSR